MYIKLISIFFFFAFIFVAYETFDNFTRNLMFKAHEKNLSLKGNKDE